MWTVDELLKKRKELLEDVQNVKTTSGSSAIAHALKENKEMLRDRGVDIETNQ